MSSTAVGAQLTETHRVSQAQLARSLMLAIAGAWAAFDVANPAATWSAFAAAAGPLIADARRDSTRLAAEYFPDFRAAEGAAGAAAARLAPMPTTEQLLARARTILVPATVLRIPTGRQLDQLNEFAFTNLAGEAARQALNGGRSTIDYSVQEDRQAIGWARVTTANPCAFCAMLASRGPVYKNREFAQGGRTGPRNAAAEALGLPYSERIGGYRAHAHCACTAEPIYSSNADWPGRSREFAEIWQETSQGTTSSQEAFVAFRRRLEGR